MKRLGLRRVFGIVFVFSLSLALVPALASAQALDENCVVTINGSTARVNPDGSFLIGNVLAGTNLVRVTATCNRPGLTLYGASDFIQVAANTTTFVSDVVLSPTPLPTLQRIVVKPVSSTLMEGETTQVQVTGFFSDGSSLPISLRSEGSAYQSSNVVIATVDQDGLVTAVGVGIVSITVTNQGATAVTILSVAPLGDPLTTVDGFVTDEQGGFLKGAVVTVPVYGGMDVTDATGHFSIVDVPTQLSKPVYVEAQATSGNQSRFGIAGPLRARNRIRYSILVFPAGGVTDCLWCDRRQGTAPKVQALAALPG